MRRTLKFLKWKSSVWVAASLDSGHSTSSALREGMSAYAARQADVFTSLHNHFLSLWHGLKGLNNLPDYPAPVPLPIEEAMEGIDGGDVDLG